MKVGDKVFLYQSIEDTVIRESPFAKFLPNNYDYFDDTIVKAQCISIGKVIDTNIDELSVSINWDKNYKKSEWYLYFRQDGIWWFDNSTQDKKKSQALYDIVFNNEQQDYKWWVDTGSFSRKKDEKGSTMKTSQNNIKNIILYGSPGVGKTYNTKKLISLIEEGKSEHEIFEIIKSNNYHDNASLSYPHDRVKFITFHQSFGYEDFIEGFRPSESGDIELIDGIFKELCIEASKNINKSLTSNKLIFEDAFDFLVKDAIEKNKKIRINLKTNNSFFEIFDYNKKSIFYTRQGKNQEEKYHTLSVSTLKTMYDSESNNIIVGGLKTYYSPILEKILNIGNRQKIEQVKKQNYYLVIDEINRGNISKIFGELITLIEEDKRDNLEVTLPYSKKPFSIPSNLYIIGTMNSTDKSIALIDIALRRRFTFLKMKPKPELVTHKEARNTMIKLNEQLSEDNKIGHSYFMNIENDDDLKFVIEYKIEPLLEEYFYGDSDGLNKILESITI